MQMSAVELCVPPYYVCVCACVYTQTENLRRRVCLPTKSIPCHGGPLVTVRNVRRNRMRVRECVSVRAYVCAFVSVHVRVRCARAYTHCI